MSDASRRDILKFAGALGASAFVPDLAVAAEATADADLVTLKGEVDKFLAAYDVEAHLARAQYKNVFKPAKGPLYAVQARLLAGSAFPQRFVFHVPEYEQALGFAVTPKGGIADVRRMTAMLVGSIVDYREFKAAEVFNKGRLYNPAIGGDGVSLFSRDHPHETGSWSNALDLAHAIPRNPIEYPQQLAQVTADAIVNIRSGLVDDEGLRIVCSPQKLIVPTSRMLDAARILRADLKSEEFAIGKFVKSGGYFAWDWLEQGVSTPWFIQTDVDGLMQSDHGPPKLSSRVNNGAVEVMIYDKTGFGHTDPRAVYGIFPKADDVS